MNTFLILILFLLGLAALAFIIDSMILMFTALLKHYGLIEQEAAKHTTFFPYKYHQSLKEKILSIFQSKKKETKIHHRELMKVLLGLDDESLEKLFEFYKTEFGAGAARYARKTYQKWENGDVRPIKQTFERFLLHLPKVMSYDLKCEVLRHLMEEYCAKDKYQLTVYTDNWEEALEPLVKKIIDKPYTAELPKQIEDRLKWLADGETRIAQDILRRSQVEEGKIAVSMLRQEFANIENLLENTKGRRKITHQLKFPYGTINLKIKQR